MPSSTTSFTFEEAEIYINSFRSSINSFFLKQKLSSYKNSESHYHARSELIYCLKGLINCQVENCLWIIPEKSALWIPAGQLHKGFGAGDVEFFTTFIDEKYSNAMPREAFVMRPSPLLRELISTSASFDQSYSDNTPESRIFSVLFDELRKADRFDLIVPMPKDLRLQFMIEQILRAPADKTTHAEWAARLALSERSFSRLIMQDLGMTLGRWRHQLHISIAIPKIRNGETVQKISHDLGYANSSSFITMFKNIMYIPPNKFAVKTRKRKTFF